MSHQCDYSLLDILHISCPDHINLHSILSFVALITLYYVFFTNQAVWHRKPWDSCTWEWASACPVVVQVQVQELGRTGTASYSPTENNRRYIKNTNKQRQTHVLCPPEQHLARPAPDSRESPNQNQNNFEPIIKQPERFPRSDGHAKSMNKLTLNEPANIIIQYYF